MTKILEKHSGFNQNASVLVSTHFSLAKPRSIHEIEIRILKSSTLEETSVVCILRIENGSPGKRLNPFTD